MIEIVRHLGKYQQKKIDFDRAERVLATVNPQEIKQVVLNLMTNALDCAVVDGRRGADRRDRAATALAC